MKKEEKTLVILVHPDIEKSVINKRWVEELQKYPDQYHIHNLYKAYPDEKLDIEREQMLIEAFDKIVFQFPFYWFSAPPLLKKWLDDVLVYGWAYGSKSGYKFAEKKVALAISVGIDEEEYSEAGIYSYTLKELTTPFELTFKYIKADYKPLYAYYGIERNASPEWIEKSIPTYIEFLEKM
ncbi:NAD(P)H-dependent oxidoreductase [Elizabethkingia anophelis]|uniref:NAD(P)H oxidoreductase YRKL / Putative NADPH-quinone reductase (Modulator of drug activity B) / Flavodoxin 2 n=1 Tax=Elizabethkingia anophelis NUHP1 TaxID=1338011 RepID=A0A077EHQ1_9FLAO|nr:MULTISPECIES: NAD(P)H-dependent oxidoreductase [Elizabethkingia]AIL45714.1 NAD(P)H oxidoreductase YRKL / Putative NADPH-quinone reductase (modulator of drug activity B) / Flavodoxin 2 [Elizabethkingia anophelis NUHP1]AMR40490.1 NAD(P)H oxidoreductase [Elizabethkingia anophelis]AMX47124.1 NAD(P)H oxidoreductase [Elizabethkingia anophelis]AMX50586.1 NAD(P)H oxidoreductase [Elizabethkingia anophelis]AMX53976.1 NAD(P)H oxidoreductase [Elizabethkingia anophelis]